MIRRNGMRIVDLRSDTITKPTRSMQKAMAQAEVGDDVFGEDPTVNRLEEMAADCMGKEAALFVASGTMANLVSQLAHCHRGDEMILGDQAHIFFYEQGGSAAIGGIHIRTVPNQSDGKIALQDIEAAIRPDDIHFPRTKLVVLENTHLRCHGNPLDMDYMKSVGELASRYELKLHVDGARIFNAAVALEVEAGDLVGKADSVSFCLSKGLAAPVGSVVCGSRSFIEKARRARKVLGGGMRQAGVLAAAGMISLAEMIERLADDHTNARALAEGLAKTNSISINPERVKTNIVFFDVARDDMTAEQLSNQLLSQGIKVLTLGPKRLRAVTHYHITSDDIQFALAVFAKVMG
jgi:threonine aldolase